MSLVPRHVDDPWYRTADALGIPVSAFGPKTFLDLMLTNARLAAKARDDFSAYKRALKTLGGRLPEVRETLEREIRLCEIRISAFPRQGPKAVDAYFVAKRVAAAFKSVGRPVTYGVSSDGALPSTPFCKAVAQAFAIFEIDCGWRGAAHAAWRNNNEPSSIG